MNKITSSNNCIPDAVPLKSQIHFITTLDWTIYHCLLDNNESPVTSDVIITEKQLSHIRERHPETYHDTIAYLYDILNDPDYIIRDKRPSTGLVIKRILFKSKYMLLVLRLCTAKDSLHYKNSVITSWEISDSRLTNYLKNKEIIYKKE